MTRILVTGANGHLGRRLLRAAPARAAVRSSRAAAMLDAAHDVHIVDYADVDGLSAACADCTAIVHLVGIIRETAGTTFQSAHENATQALVQAAVRTGVRRIVYLSILGADEASPNRALASKARAESLLLRSSVPSLVIRVPMVLGEGDYAAHALLSRASSRFAVTFRAKSREQPIYAGDVVAAIRAGLAENAPTGVLELAGPRSLSRRELIAAASTVGTRTLSVPIAWGYALAWLLARVTANPPLTRDLLGVLDHDDDVDPHPAARLLGIRLTSLEQTLDRVRAAQRGDTPQPRT